MSIYYKDYRPWEADGASQKDQARNINKFQKTNLVFGTDKIDGMYASVKDKEYIKHENFQPSLLADDKKKDLRSHHFEFGGWEPNMTTTSKIDYVAKQGQAPNMANRQKQTNKMRKHNFSIANGQEVRPQASTYLRHYQGEQGEGDTRGMSKEELQQKLIELRNTHMVLGQDKPTNLSTMKRDYTKKKGDRVELNRMALQKSHFDLGDTPQNLQSVNRMTYVAHQNQGPQNQMEKQKLIDDLRSKILL